MLPDNNYFEIIKFSFEIKNRFEIQPYLRLKPRTLIIITIFESEGPKTCVLKIQTNIVCINLTFKPKTCIKIYLIVNEVLMAAFLSNKQTLMHEFKLLAK